MISSQSQHAIVPPMRNRRGNRPRCSFRSRVTLVPGIPRTFRSALPRSIFLWEEPWRLFCGLMRGRTIVSLCHRAIPSPRASAPAGERKRQTAALASEISSRKSPTVRTPIEVQQLTPSFRGDRAHSIFHPVGLLHRQSLPQYPLNYEPVVDASITSPRQPISPF